MNFKTTDKGFSIWLSENIKKKENEFASKAKSMKCYLCGKDVTSYKNSHSIPQFILSNISKLGEYSNFSSLIDVDFLKMTTGKNNAGTFHLLCESCEGKALKYEDKSTYDDLKKPFAQTLLYEIAYKNLLYLIDKANKECSFLAAALSTANENANTIPKEYTLVLNDIKSYISKQFYIASERLKSCEAVFKYDHFCFAGKYKAFKIALQIELPYRVPIASQLAIPVAKGINGEIINNFIPVKASDGEFIVKHNFLHVCVFPLEGKSLVLLFCHAADKYYDKFIADINELEVTEQTRIINFMLFQFAEDYFCNMDTIAKIVDNKELKKLCRMRSVCDLTNSRNTNIPNLLSSEFKL